MTVLCRVHITTTECYGGWNIPVNGGMKSLSAIMQSISPAVVAEILGTRDEQTKEKLLGLVLDYPQLELSPEIERIANGYIGQKIIPPNYATDAFHIAVASYYKADFLVTWNCRHLADGHRRKKIKLFNTSAGLYVPEILTPLELTGGEEDVVQ